MQSPFLLVPEGSGIFKTYTLILPGIKKRPHGSSRKFIKKIIKKLLTKRQNRVTIIVETKASPQNYLFPKKL